jgi:predicted TIM-barrel fold metal-dependent hydrolase
VDFTLIAAHFAGYGVWEEAARKLPGYDNLYVDSCSSLEFLEPSRAVELINLYGEDKVLFGTDYPMWNHKDELARVERLDLPPATLRKILYQNAKDLFFRNGLEDRDKNCPAG